MSANYAHGVDRSGRFRVAAPLSVFEKADGPEDKRRRIGGLISTESLDRDGEVILQRGLNFQPFLQHGWFNDNHNQQTSKAVGYPTAISFVKKGTRLPNGQVAPSDGHWAEGYLLRGHGPADELWSLANSLKSEDRKLGFSIEGKIKSRHGSDGRIVAAADIYEVAVTRCPVNTDTSLDILGKSLGSVARALKSTDPIGDQHKEPDGDEGTHGRLNPDAAFDSEEEQIKTILGGVEGVVNQLQGDFGFPGNNVGLGMGDPKGTHVDPIKRAMTSATAAPLFPQTLREDRSRGMDKSVATEVISGLLQKSLESKLNARSAHTSEMIRKASADIVELALAAENKELNMTDKKDNANSLEVIAKGVLDSLQALIATSPEGRKHDLLKKAGSGQLTGAEADELSRLVKGGAAGSLAGTVAEIFAPAEDLAKSAKGGNAAEFLLTFQDSMVGAVQALTETIEKSDTGNKTAIGVMAKGLLDLGEAHIVQAKQLAEAMKLVKSLEAKLDQYLATPAYAPKSAQVFQQQLTRAAQAPAGQPVAVPGAQQVATEQPARLSKSQVLDLMLELSEKADHTNGGLSKSGIPWGPAITLWEMENQIAQPLLTEVQEFYRSKQAH